MAKKSGWAILASLLVITAAATIGGGPAAATDGGRWTTNLDFDKGTLVGVNHTAVADQLQLNVEQSTFPYIWVANSGEGTIAKLDTRTGAEVGRYRTAPDGTPADPSRTTVDLDGNVWVGNRASNTITKVGLNEWDNCVDRNGNGVIETSTGPLDVKPWPSTGGPADECVLLHVVLDQGGNNVRAVAIDAQNNVFAGMSAGDNLYYVDGKTGTILSADRHNLGRINYGAVVDPEGNLWVSAFSGGLVKHPKTGEPVLIQPGHTVYGIAPDHAGNIWVSGWDTSRLSQIRRSDGAVLDSIQLQAGCYRGVAVTNDGNVWVANSCGNSVVRLDPAAHTIKTIPVGTHPTGVAVDAAGKVWATNLLSNNVSRIDPATNTVDGTFAVGLYPYNYSDMTGMIVRNVTTRTGTWTVVQDSGTAGMRWGTLTWNGEQPEGTAITARVRAAETEAGLGGAPWLEGITSGARFDAAGRFLQIELKLTTTKNGVTPVLYDVALEQAIVECYGLDIKGANGLNPGARGEVPVVLQGQEGCAVAAVDWTTVRFGPSGADPVRAPQYADHTGDGIEDAMFHFLMQESGIRAGDPEACVVGELTDGRSFRSCQAIRTTPPKK